MVAEPKIYKSFPVKIELSADTDMAVLAAQHQETRVGQQREADVTAGVTQSLGRMQARQHHLATIKALEQAYLRTQTIRLTYITVEEVCMFVNFMLQACQPSRGTSYVNNNMTKPWPRVVSLTS